MTKRIAECCCGQLTISVTGEPIHNGICHCNDCKKRTGSAFGQSSYFNQQQVNQINGQANCYSLHNKAQAHDQKRYFCQNCGSTLYWSISTQPDLIGIAAGCFIQTPLPEPSYSVNHKQKCSWLSLPSHWQVQE